MMVKHLLPLVPEHNLYCEPFFGGGALFFAKPKSKIEVINDLNGEVINFYRTVQLQFDVLEQEIKATLHSRDLFRQATVVYQNPDMFTPVKRAWAFWTLANQGFSSTLTSWGAGNDDSKPKSLARKRECFLSYYADRLNTVQIECADALKVIERCDTPDTFFYIDPPYFNSHMGHYSGYTEHEYEQLLALLSTIKGKFLISGYPSKILSDYSDKFCWQSLSFEKPISVTKNSKRSKTEVLSFNYTSSFLQ